jgi:hypothetical protein
MIRQFVLWSLPLLIIPVSFIVSRFFPFRKIRYGCYAMVLVTAFAFNLFRASFWNEIADTGMILLINFIFADFFWNILAIKNRKIVLSFIVIGTVVFGTVHFRWIVSGPTHVDTFINPGPVSLFTRDEIQYAVKERKLFYLKKPVRIFTLARKFKNWPFETEIHSYRTPDGFYGTTFSYKWTETDQGARVDLRTAGYTLWTMGEGF